MQSLVSARDAGSSPLDIAVPVLVTVFVLGVIWAFAAVRRASARKAHAQVAVTGHGVWFGAVTPEELVWVLPDLDVSYGRLLLTVGDGMPVSVELSPSGLCLRLRGWALRPFHDQAWVVPWTDVVGAISRPAGYRSVSGKLSILPQTDLLITVVGDSAADFRDWWVLDDDVDDNEPPPTPEDDADDAAWLAEVSEDLGPDWVPGTALLRVRTSAPDGFTDAVTRWARGKLPADNAP